MERMPAKRSTPSSHVDHLYTRDVMDRLLDAVLTIDKSYVILSANSSVEKLFGYAPEEAAGQPLSDLIPSWSDYDWFDRGWRETYLQAQRDPNFQPLRGLHLDGSRFLLDLEIQEVAVGGEILLILSLCNRSARQMSEHLIRLASGVFEHTHEGIMVTDANGLIEFVNPAFVEMTGYAPDEAIGRNPRLLQSGWHDADFYRTMWESLNTDGYWSGEIWNRRKNGEVYPQWLTINCILDAEGRVIQHAAMFSDISKQKQSEETIHHQAYHDALTGLPNRLLFLDRLALAVSDAQRLGLMAAVLFLDLDRFKLINDTLGHNFGDQLLQLFAERLQDIVRDRDTVCRLGGDEFTIIMETISQMDEAVLLAQKILSSFEAPITLDGQEFYVTPSIGIALYPDDGTEIEALVKNADAAMYRAKEQGNNYQLYTPAMNSQASQRLNLENDLRRALERGEFVVHYQPQLHIASGEIIGMEALVRWQHHARGLISPAEFIPLAEETGLIVPIGEWVLRTACAQSKAWTDAGFRPIRVAVNLSARQFQQNTLVETVDRVLSETGLPGKYLELEVTESVAMHDVEHAIVTLHRLKQLGIQISIDDFGTGYSSLSYLSKFPIQTLKIDRSFVNDITTNREDGAIAASVILMAHSLCLNVIAEGVETEEQLDFLRERGCDEFQGFLFSAPLSADRFEALLASGASLERR